MSRQSVLVRAVRPAGQILNNSHVVINVYYNLNNFNIITNY